MKKQIKKILVSSLMALAFGAMTVGTTYALFTSQAKTEISVEAGKVKVEQNLAIVSVKELGDVAVVPNEGVYTNSIGGKTYVDSTTGELKLEKWAPGDKAVITLTNKNESNVTIKTRFATEHTSTSTPDLYNALDISYAFAAGYSDAITAGNYKDWTVLDAPQTDNHVISTITVTIEFPDSHNGEITFGSENDDNQYQDTNCAILFTQQAVQGNATTQTIINVTDTASFQGALDNLEDNDEEITVKLAAGNYGDVVIDASKNKGNTVVYEKAAHNTALSPTYEFDYRYRSLSNVKILGGEGVNVRSIRLLSGRCGVTKGYNQVPQDPGNGEDYTFDGLEIKNLTIEGIKFVGAGVYVFRGYNTYDWAEMIAGTQKLGDFDGIKIENCKFEPYWDNGNIPEGYFARDHHYGGVHVQTLGVDNLPLNEQYIYTKNVTINNCEFKNILGVAGNIQDTCAIYLDDVEGAIKITNNTFNNVYFNHIQINRGFKHDGTITITGNHFGDNHDRMLRFNDNYSGLTAFNCSGNYFYLTSTEETSGPYGKSSVSSLNSTYFPNGKLPIGANYWQDSNITDWTPTSVLNGFSINNNEQSYFA